MEVFDCRPKALPLTNPTTPFIGRAGTGSSISGVVYNRSVLGCFRNASALASFLKRAVSGSPMMRERMLEDDFCFLGSGISALGGWVIGDSSAGGVAGCDWPFPASGYSSLVFASSCGTIGSFFSGPC